MYYKLSYFKITHNQVNTLYKTILMQNSFDQNPVKFDIRKNYKNFIKIFINMPGWELIGKKKKNLNQIFTKSNVNMFVHGFENLRNYFFQFENLKI